MENVDTEKGAVSTQTLVSTGGQQSASKLTQYAAAIAVTLGGFGLGNVLAWTSPTGPKLEVTLGETDWAWIGALMALGAAVAVIPIGYLIDTIGRKYTMLGLVIPFAGGWAFIAWADAEAALYMVGRFITGMMGGAFSLTAPAYTSEISEKEIRGMLGTFFQLMITLGILFVYGVGSAVSVRVLSIICGCVPLLFGVIFCFMPETPLYYLKKGYKERAQSSLQWFRGKHYDVTPELQELQKMVDETAAQKLSFRQAFSTTEAKRGLMITFGLMLFQQLSGINAVIFYTTTIFKAAGSDIEPTIQTIIVGVIQVVVTFISTLVIDRVGRRILLMISDCVMAICTLVLGIYFYLMEQGNSDGLGWLPLTSVCLFIVAFSLGFGPIPWMIVGELFAPNIKGIASSLSCVFNWILAFLVTRFYSDLAASFGIHVTYWIFAVISGIGTVFVFFIVPETKGKSLHEIQRVLGGSGSAPQAADVSDVK